MSSLDECPISRGGPVARIRKDVWNLTREEGDWPKDLVAYERAVGLMRAADPPTARPWMAAR